MPVVSRGALLVATASMATCVLAGPGAAYAADTSTQLTAAEMVAELKTVGNTSATAAADGWKANLKLSAGSFSGTEYFVADPIHGVAFFRYSMGGDGASHYIVAGKGTYDQISDPESRAALQMMHRTSVKYAYSPNRGISLDDQSSIGGISPKGFLTDDVDYPGTKTVHDDGTTDYQLNEDGDTLTVHVSAAGVLTSAAYVSPDNHGEDYTVDFGYAYGPQHITLPSPGVTIGSGALGAGVAYLHMPTTVKQVAGMAATDTLEDSDGHQVAATLLRKDTRDDVTEANDGFGFKMLKTKSVSGGIRVYATNPWTHRTTAYTLTASGKKVTIAKK
jgi:hypothetical protein